MSVWKRLVCAFVGHNATRAHGNWIHAYTGTSSRRLTAFHGCLRCGALWMTERNALEHELTPKEPVMRSYTAEEWAERDKQP